MQTVKSITFEAALNMVKQLSLANQMRLLEWIARQVKQTLSQSCQTFQPTPNGEQLVGVPGSQLIKFAGLIPPEELQQMRQAIDVDCAKVDMDEW